MTTKPQLQKIFQGILHTESESKQNHERAGSTKPRAEEKERKKRVTLNELHTIKLLNNKDN
jgi:hypothetical protein